MWGTRGQLIDRLTRAAQKTGCWTVTGHGWTAHGYAGAPRLRGARRCFAAPARGVTGHHGRTRPAGVAVRRAGYRQDTHGRRDRQLRRTARRSGGLGPLLRRRRSAGVLAVGASAPRRGEATRSAVFSFAAGDRSGSNSEPRAGDPGAVRRFAGRPSQ